MATKFTTVSQEELLNVEGGSIWTLVKEFVKTVLIDDLKENGWPTICDGLNGACEKAGIR